jgi:E3 ubiquitin-protein ligase UBR4
VALIATMMKDSEILKKVVQSNVTIVIMSYLRIRKLNLTKNKTIQNCEVEIEKMFKELHSQREEEKENFIIECMKIIESGECDLQEQRFLLEEICKVIDPVKPEPIYLLNLNKAPSQEFFLRGKMSKNPYTN